MVLKIDKKGVKTKRRNDNHQARLGPGLSANLITWILNLSANQHSTPNTKCQSELIPLTTAMNHSQTDQFSTEFQIKDVQLTCHFRRLLIWLNVS